MTVELSRRLLAAGVPSADIEAALFLSVARGIPMARALVDRGVVNERTLEDELSRWGGIAVRQVSPAPELWARLPMSMCRRLGAVPLRVDAASATLEVAAIDPLDPHVASEFAFHLGMSVRVQRATLGAIEEALRRLELGETEGASSRSRRRTPAFPHGAPKSSVPPPPAEEVPIPLVRRVNPPAVVDDEEELSLVTPRPSRAINTDAHQRAVSFPSAPPPPGPASSMSLPSAAGVPGQAPAQPSAQSQAGQPPAASQADARTTPTFGTRVLAPRRTHTPALGSLVFAPMRGGTPALGTPAVELPRPRQAEAVEAPAEPPPRAADTPPAAVEPPPMPSHHPEDSRERPSFEASFEAPGEPDLGTRSSVDWSPSETLEDGFRRVSGEFAIAVPPQVSALAAPPPQDDDGSEETTQVKSRRPPPAPDAPRSLEESLDVLGDAQGRDAVVEAALASARFVAPRVAVFVVRRDGYHGWACSPEFGDATALREVVIPHKSPSIFATATAAGFYLGPVPSTPGHAGLLGVMRHAGPDVAVSVVRVAGKPAMVLVAEGLDDSMRGTKALGEIARVAGFALSRVLSSR